jgi:PII-like signaling protein
MRTHAKKKIEIIVERPLLDEVVRLLKDNGAKGHTVFQATAGRGANREWDLGGVTGAFDRVLVLTIVDATAAERIVSLAFDLLQDYTAILYVSDVQVVRGDRF